MEYVYAIVLRGDVKPKRWWNVPREASAFSMGTLEAVPGVTRVEVVQEMVRRVREQNPQLVNTYPEMIYLDANDVLAPIPEQPPVVTTGVITAVKDDGSLDVSTDRAKQPVLDLANDTQMFTPVTPQTAAAVS